MNNENALAVFYKEVLIGTLRLDETGRMIFDYSPGWIDTPSAFPISRSIPLDGSYKRGVKDHAFFANLLPEADVRETLCRFYGISLSNDFGLLRKIGGECAGALSLFEEGTAPVSEGSYRQVTEEELSTAVATKTASKRLIPDRRVRFSLAGGQDKWPILFENGKLYLPEGAAASSHILKFDSLRFKGTGWNEAYVSFLARKLGLPAVEVRPFQGYSLIERYDRKRTQERIVERLHQEDFCQALGLPANSKYESEGGPSFNQCLDLVRRAGSLPAIDSMNLIRWHIANVVFGNADGHAKNLSLLYEGRQCRLAPFYDLVCTGIYEGISRDLAMAVGKEHDPGQVRKRDWETLAENAGIRPRVVFSLLEEMTAKLSNNLHSLTREFSVSFGNHPVIDRIRVHIRDQVRRTRSLAFENLKDEA